MHPEADRLRALIDQELSEAESRRVHQHLTACPQCRARLQTLQARANAVTGRLNALAPQPYEKPTAPQLAYSRFTSRRRPAGFAQEVLFPMLTRRPVWITLAVLAAVIVAFSFSPVRVWASDILGLFRVQRVEVISIDPADLEAVQQSIEENESAIRAVFKEDLQFNTQGDIEPVESVDAVQAAAGFAPRLPAGWDAVQLAVRPAMDAILTIDQPKFQALIDAIGMDFELSPDLNGEVVSVHAPAAVVAAQGCDAVEVNERHGKPDCPVLVQLSSPVVDSPDGLEMNRVGEAVLQLFGLSELEASLVSQRIDWTTTLVLPLPQSGEVYYQELEVDGVTGTYLQEPDDEGFALVWVKDGVLYGLYAPGDAAEAARIANSLQ